MPRSQLSPFQLVFDHNPAALAVTRRRDSVIIEVNDAFCALVSYKREEIIGATALNLGIWPQPSDRSRLVAEIESSGRVQNMQVPLRARDHSLRYVEVSSELTDFGGEPCLLTMIIDRTERHHVEQERDQALAEAEQFRAALDNVPAFVYMKDLEHRYTYANAMTLE
ncbi:MAG TPA: PAS domain S-box protein, partial [Turneriella sp.]|nr:PAS domain S-box protein [Turneriella sp.]